MEYRFYGFGNYYLSSLQQGLQSAHCIADMFVKYKKKKAQKEIVYDWAENHKTMVLLNGGNSLMLAQTHQFFEELKNEGMDLPFQLFHEDEQSLNGALTYVGIVVPSEIYELAASLRSGLPKVEKKKKKTNKNKAKGKKVKVVEENDWKHRLAMKLNQFGLAH
jgi:hypothetical protein